MNIRLVAMGFATAAIAAMVVPLTGNATMCVDDFVWIIIANMRPTLFESGATRTSRMPGCVIRRENACMHGRAIT